MKIAEARLNAAQASWRNATRHTNGRRRRRRKFVRAAGANSGRRVRVSAALGRHTVRARTLPHRRTDRVKLQAHVPAADSPLGAAIDEIALEIPRPTGPARRRRG